MDLFFIRIIHKHFIYFFFFHKKVNKYFILNFLISPKNNNNSIRFLCIKFGWIQTRKENKVGKT